MQQPESGKRILLYKLSQTEGLKAMGEDLSNNALGGADLPG